MNLNDLKYKFYVSLFEALKGSSEFIKWIVPYIVPITEEGIQPVEENSFSDVVEKKYVFVVQETIPKTAIGLKRKAQDPINNEDAAAGTFRPTKSNRQERTAEEIRITKQIEELRKLLAHGGVRMPTGTKSAVLTETAQYIRQLQQQQPQSGAVGTDAATTNKKRKRSGTTKRRHASRRDNDDDDSIECIKVTQGGLSCGGNRNSRSKTALNNDNYPDNDDADSIKCIKVMQGGQSCGGNRNSRSKTALNNDNYSDNDDDDNIECIKVMQGGQSCGGNRSSRSKTALNNDNYSDNDDDDNIECIKVMQGGQSCGGNRSSRSKTALKKKQLLEVTTTTTASASMMPDSYQSQEDPPSNDDDTGTLMIEKNKLMNRGEVTTRICKKYHKNNKVVTADDDAANTATIGNNIAEKIVEFWINDKKIGERSRRINGNIGFLTRLVDNRRYVKEIVNDDLKTVVHKWDEILSIGDAPLPHKTKKETAEILLKNVTKNTERLLKVRLRRDESTANVKASFITATRETARTTVPAKDDDDDDDDTVDPKAIDIELAGGARVVLPSSSPPSSNQEENISNASKTKRKRQNKRTRKTRKHVKKKKKKKNPPVVVPTAASDTVAEGNEEYIDYQIRRLWNDGNYYIGTVVTSITPRFTHDNVLVRTVAYADGDKDIVDEKQLREWKYTTVNDDDDDDDDDADSSHDDDDTVAEGNPKKAGAASIIDSIQDKSHSIRIDNRKKEAKQTRRRFGTRR